MISTETLRFFPLFARQSVDMLAQIALLAEDLEVEAGYQLFLEGDEAKALFLIIEGSVVLTMNMGETGDQTIEELEPVGKWDMVGWSSIVWPHTYKLGAYTGEKSRLVKIDAVKLHKLFDENPAYGYFFMHKLAEVIGDRLNSKFVQIMSLVK